MGRGEVERRAKRGDGERRVGRGGYREEGGERGWREGVERVGRVRVKCG